MINFIDFAAALDSVKSTYMWKILLEDDGVPARLLKVIKSYYAHTRATVRSANGESDFFNFHNGVRQGCILSPTLFSLTIDWVLEHAGFQIGPTIHITDPAYADDISLLAKTTKSYTQT